MSDEKQCTDLMDSLLAAHATLNSLLLQHCSECVGYDIQQITKADEEVVIEHGIDRLSVTSASRSRVLSFHEVYKRHIDLSTQFVERLPGLIVVNSGIEDIVEVVSNINAIKDNIMAIVKNGRDRYQRHEFIHNVFPRIMTDQLRRHVHIIDENITNCWFNWATRPIPKTYTIEQAITLLKASVDKPKGLFSNEEWRSLIEANVHLLSTGKFSSVQHPKSLKLLPIATYKCVTAENEIKRKTRNTNTPFILIGQENGKFPKVAPLNTYIKAEETDAPLKLDKRVKNREVLNPYLKLVGVLA